MSPSRPHPPPDRLAIFSFLWAVATLAHHAAFPWWFDRHAIVNVTLLAAALFVMARPRSIAAFAALAGLGLLNVIKQAPFHPNHILFEGFVDAIILAALLSVRLQQGVARSEAERREALFDRFAAPVRIAYLLLFVFAFLHKLNRDFIRADVSCAVFFTDALLVRAGLPPLEPWGREVAIWAALSIEAAIPLGLLFARTRAVGVALALLFHLLLAQIGLTPLYSFAAMAFALLFLFTPLSFTAAIAALLEKRRRPYPRDLATGTIALALILVSATFFGASGLWSLWALVLLGLFVRGWRDSGRFVIERAFVVQPGVLWIFLVLLAVNAVSPYLGLKTQTAFSMYSNLRTEGGRTNHLFLGRLDLGSWQDDLVQVTDSDLPELVQVRDADLLLPYFQLRFVVGMATGDFRVEYVRGGEKRTLIVRKGDAGDPAATPPPWWLRKVLRFRPLEREGPTRCRH